MAEDKRRFPWISGAALVVSNLVPLWFVLFRGWDVSLVIFLFWCENVITGVMNVCRMAVCANQGGPPGTPLRREGPDGTRLIHFYAKASAIPFFVIHYGMFTAAHGALVFGLVTGLARESGESVQHELWLFAIPILALFGSHLVSFFVNFIGQQEYQKTTVKNLLYRPYGRVVGLHIGVLLGGAAVAASEDQLSNLGIDPYVFPLILLLGIKILFDLGMHTKERKKLGGPLPVAHVAGDGRAADSESESATPEYTRSDWMRVRDLWLICGIVAGFVFCAGGPALLSIVLQPNEPVQTKSAPSRSAPATVEKPAPTRPPAPVAQSPAPAATTRRQPHEKLYEYMAYEEVNTLLGVTGQKKRAIRRGNETRITYEWRLKDADVVVTCSFEKDRLLSWEITDAAKAVEADETQPRQPRGMPGAPGGPFPMRRPAPPPSQP